MIALSQAQQVNFLSTPEYAEFIQKQRGLRAVVNTYDDLVDLRKRALGRLAEKKDGKPQADADMRIQDPETVEFLQEHKKCLNSQIKSTEKQLRGILERDFPELWDWFNNDPINKCVAVIGASKLIAYLNPFISDKPSSWHRYCGYDPTYVNGKINLDKKKMEAAIKEHPNWKVLSSKVSPKTGKKRFIVLTDKQIRADRETKEYLLPYNGYMKTQLNGVIFPCLMKGHNAYYNEIYDNARHRYDCHPTWKYKSPANRSDGARRIVMQRFLINLMVKWRSLYGLTTRPPYEEEKFGRKHGTVDNTVSREVVLPQELSDLSSTARELERSVVDIIDAGKDVPNSATIRMATKLQQVLDSPGWKYKDQASGHRIDVINSRISSLHEQTQKLAKSVNAVVVAEDKKMEKKLLNEAFRISNGVYTATENIGRFWDSQSRKMAMVK